MSDELHPVIDFLVKRMASHPEEFSTTYIQGGRWGFVLDQIGWFTTDEEKALLFSKVREHVFEGAHQQILAELLKMEEPKATTSVSNQTSGTVSVSGYLTPSIQLQPGEIVFDRPVVFRKGFKSV